ncbi:hypothetical protein HAX54_047225, partial [Datura stramonium]|nr:hypothetical protein [Datura stramonium]
MWKGVKKIYCTLLPGPRVPQLFSRDVLEYSFLSVGEDEVANDLIDGIMRPSASRDNSSAAADLLWRSTSRYNESAM